MGHQLTFVQKYYNPMSLDDADKIVPQIHLAKLIGSLAPSDKTPSRIIVMAPEYLKNLSSILDDTSKEVLHTHLLWKQIQAYSSYIEADAVLPLSQFTNELQGKVRSFVAPHGIDLTNSGPRFDSRAMENLCWTCR